MASGIQSFDGAAIEGSFTSSGVFAAFDWEQLVLGPIGAPILSKARARADVRLRGFPPQDHDRLTRKLGHYSDVQSLNCEDTVTWSVFGAADKEGWLNDVLDELFGPAMRPRNWRLSLWSRIPHPDTGVVQHGPESDVVIESGEWRYVVEAKWTSDISEHKNGQSQVQMRAYQARLHCASPEKSGVVVIAPEASGYRHATIENSLFSRYFVPRSSGYIQREAARELNAQAISWQRLLEIIASRGRPHLEHYLAWRLSLIR